ncbi:MAG: ATP-binding protein [Leptolyngbya sp. SIO4C1]|nr:ATP-binding protein [Leptolyngbya sp. SIO4C1]
MLKQDNLIVQSQLEQLTEVQQWFQRFCATSGMPWVKDAYDQLNLALAEGFTNAVRHAHAELPAETPIQLELHLWMDRIEAQIWDWGDPFDPSLIQEPEPGTLSEGGYGWFLLRRLADQVEYKRDRDRNCLWIVKYARDA